MRQSVYRLQLADVGIGREISQMYPQEKLLNVLKSVHVRRPIGRLCHHKMTCFFPSMYVARVASRVF